MVRSFVELEFEKSYLYYGPVSEAELSMNMNMILFSVVLLGILMRLWFDRLPQYQSAWYLHFAL